MTSNQIYTRIVRNSYYKGYSDNIKFFETFWKNNLPKIFYEDMYESIFYLSKSLDKWLSLNNFDKKLHGIIINKNPFELKFKQKTNEILVPILNLNKIYVHYNAYYAKEKLIGGIYSLDNIKEIPIELKKIKNTFYFQLYFCLKKIYVGFEYANIENYIKDKSKLKNFIKKDKFSYTAFKKIKYSIIGAKEYLEKNIPNSALNNYLDFYSDNPDKYSEILSQYNPLGSYKNDKRTQILLDKLSFKKNNKNMLFVANLPDREVIEKNVEFEKSITQLISEGRNPFKYGMDTIEQYDIKKRNFWGYSMKPLNYINTFDNIKISHNGICDAICIDIDTEVELINILDDVELPPNIVVINKTDNNTVFKKSKCHLYYIFDEPVFMNNNKSSKKVKAMIRAIHNALNFRFGGDYCYTNVYAKNPISNNKVAFSTNLTPYKFVDLYKKIIELGIDTEIPIKLSKKETLKKFNIDSSKYQVINENRNVHLYKYGVFEAYKDISIYKYDFNSLERMLLIKNEVSCMPPLPKTEVKTIARSIYKTLQDMQENTFFINGVAGNITPIQTLKSISTRKKKSMLHMEQVFNMLKEFCNEKWSLIFPLAWKKTEIEPECAYKEKLTKKMVYGILSFNKELMNELIAKSNVNRSQFYGYLKFFMQYYAKFQTLDVKKIENYDEKFTYTEAVSEVLRLTNIEFSYDNENISNDLKIDIIKAKCAELNKGKGEVNYENLLTLDNISGDFVNSDNSSIIIKTMQFLNDKSILAGYYFYKLYLLRNHIQNNSIKNKNEEIIIHNLITGYAKLILNLVNYSYISLTTKLRNLIDRLISTPLLEIKFAYF